MINMILVIYLFKHTIMIFDLVKNCLLQQNLMKNLLLPPIDLIEVVKEEVKEETRLKFLLPNKLLIRLPMLLAQIKAGNISKIFENTISIVSS